MIKLTAVEVLLLLSLVMSVYCEQTTIRHTNNGPVEGIEEISSLGQPYCAFRGIPYAEPPITGIDPYTHQYVDRRFKATVPIKRTWTEILQVHNFRDFCIPSLDFPCMEDETKKSEDCLFVNIYVPAGGERRKTVLVWIHGGAYAFGSSSDLESGPDFFLYQDVIVVTIEYRLGIYGFLNLGFGDYTGNMGLKDQQCALKWIYENIEEFSGNKEEICLMGESAGGASVSHQMLSDESRKYFNRAFLSSSTALCFYAMNQTSHLERMQNFAKIQDKQKLVEYLKTEKSDVLAMCYTFNKDTAKLLPVPWAPTMEHSYDVRPFITKTPEEIYYSNKAPRMDVMFAFNYKESVIFHPELVGCKEAIIKENLGESNVVLPFDNFNIDTHPKEYEETLTKLRKAYFLNPNDGDANEQANLDLMTHIIFVHRILKTVILQTIVNNSGFDRRNHRNTFLYRFNVDDSVNPSKIGSTMNWKGATHADDVCYMFHCHRWDAIKLYDKHLQEKDCVYDLIMRTVKRIVNFARTGNPSIENDVQFKSCKSANEVYCHEITNDPKTSVTTNIKEQLRYDTWCEIEETYKNLRKK